MTSLHELSNRRTPGGAKISGWTPGVLELVDERVDPVKALLGVGARVGGWIGLLPLLLGSHQPLQSTFALLRTVSHTVLPVNAFHSGLVKILLDITRRGDL